MTAASRGRRLSRLARAGFAWLMGAVCVGSLVAWWVTRPSPSRTLRIATAVGGGLYHAEGVVIAEALRAAGAVAEVVETAGSGENVALLLRGEVDVSIVQAGATPLGGLAVVTPLHRDVVLLLVCHELLESGEIAAVDDLSGRRVAVGLPGSGMRASAAEILAHYRLDGRCEVVEEHFAGGGDFDAAIVTTGIENADLAAMLGGGRYGLLPLEADAIARKHRHFERYEIPRGFWHPIPARPVPTVATAALVVVREEADDGLVRSLLGAVFEGDLTDRLATVMTPEAALAVAPARLHRVTREYYDPYGRYGVLHTLLEGLVAAKELVIAVGAGIYLLWDRWRRLRERETRAAIEEQKERLDVYLERTLAVEREQMATADPARLAELLDAVTETKLAALEELTHEDLRGDRTFSIFLMQCANLIGKIQLKILQGTGTGSGR